MFYCNDERQNENYGYGEDINIDINNVNTNTNSNFNMNQMDTQMYDPGMTVNATVEGPIVEPGKERVIQRNIIHEVRHICPMNTKIINNHIYKHTYEPRYTCCEENTCTNVQCGSCSCFN